MVGFSIEDADIKGTPAPWWGRGVGGPARSGRIPTFYDSIKGEIAEFFWGWGREYCAENITGIELIRKLPQTICRLTCKWSYSLEVLFSAILVLYCSILMTPALKKHQPASGREYLRAGAWLRGG